MKSSSEKNLNLRRHPLNSKSDSNTTPVDDPAHKESRLYNRQPTLIGAVNVTYASSSHSESDLLSIVDVSRGKETEEVGLKILILNSQLLS